MNNNTLVAGAGGQLGCELVRTADSSKQCIALSRAELDIADAKSVAEALDRLQPDQVINAAAYTAVDGAESDPEGAYRGNASGPATLAAACAERDIRLIHISTDFVFDGHASEPYQPGASTNPLGEYGRSKLAGEVAVRETLPDALIIRTGWVYSSFGGNFVKTMLRLMADRDELAVVADQVGTPTWANGLAHACWAAVMRPTVSGIYHWSDAGVCSWYDFAVAINEEALALQLLDKATSVLPIPASEYPTPAKRPAYSVLDKASCWRDLVLKGTHWRRQLRNMLADLKEMGDG
ncbi:MAG: dTDP-4-dehydrorhamnose reductase [Pseudomonadota bacterium]